jgi:Domain of unknown function (DUF4157)
MNRAVFAERTTVASKAAKAASGSLRIGPSNDYFEQEADRVAAEIMAGGRVRPDWSISRMAIDRPLQRKCSCGGSGSASGECEKCQKAGEEQSLQRKPSGAPEPKFAPSIVHEVLDSQGEPLDRATRHFFEPKFGQDLGHVRIHADSRAATSAAAVHAKAFTVGSQIAFAAHQYQPGTEPGRKLLAHELVHVMQRSRIREGLGTVTSPVTALQRTDGPGNPAGLHPAVIQDLKDKMVQLMGKVDPDTRNTLLGRKTVAIGLVEETAEPGIPRYVYTVSQNWTNKSLEKAVSDLNLTRWDPRPAQAGRGAVGAPGDAEQILLEADPSEWHVLGMAVSRKTCADCKVAIATSEHKNITVIEVKVPVVPGTPRTPPAAPRAGEGGGTPKPKSSVGTVGTETEPETSGKANATAGASPGRLPEEPPAAGSRAGGGASAMKRIGGVLLGALVETAILVGLQLLAEWLKERVERARLQDDLIKLRPSMMDRLDGLSDKILKLESEGPTFANVTVKSTWLIIVGFSEGQRTSSEHYFGTTLQDVDVSHNNIESSSEPHKTEPIPTMGGTEEVVSTYSVPLEASGRGGKMAEAISKVPDYRTIFGLTGDTDIRNWMLAHTGEIIGTLPVSEKIRLINRLLDGWVSDEDIEAIRKICGSVDSSEEARQIRSAIEPRATELEFAQRTTLRVILTKMP